MRYKAAIFDLFGTLVDNFAYCEYQAALQGMADILAVPREDFAYLWKETSGSRATGSFQTIEANVEHICRVLGLELDSERISAATQLRIEFSRNALTPRQDAIRTLSELRGAGCKTGLISDCAPDIPLLWPDTAFASLFDVAVFSCSVGLKKPNSQIYHLICERLSVMPTDCLYLGDGSSQELTGASQVGMHSVLIRVPYEVNIHESLRPDSEVNWDGPTISTLSEVLYLMD